MPEEDQVLIAEAIAWCVHVKRHRAERMCSLGAPFAVRNTLGHRETFDTRTYDGCYARADMPMCGKPTLKDLLSDSPSTTHTTDDGLYHSDDGNDLAETDSMGSISFDKSD